MKVAIARVFAYEPYVRRVLCFYGYVGGIGAVLAKLLGSAPGGALFRLLSFDV